jgi:hypothetical protein
MLCAGIHCANSARHKLIAVQNQAAIKDIGIKVSTVWPRNRPEFRINFHLREIGGIFQRSKNSAKADKCIQVDYAFHTVFISGVEAATFEGTRENDIFQHKSIRAARSD